MSRGIVLVQAALLVSALAALSVLALVAHDRGARVRELERRQPVVVFRFEKRPGGGACLLGSATGYRDAHGRLHVETSPVTGDCTP